MSTAVDISALRVKLASASFEYPCYESTAIINIFIFSRVYTVRQILTYKDGSRAGRVEGQPALTTDGGPVVRDHQKLCRTTRTFYPVVLWTTKISSPSL